MLLAPSIPGVWKYFERFLITTTPSSHRWRPHNLPHPPHRSPTESHCLRMQHMTTALEVQTAEKHRSTPGLPSCAVFDFSCRTEGPNMSPFTIETTSPDESCMLLYQHTCNMGQSTHDTIIKNKRTVRQYEHDRGRSTVVWMTVECITQYESAGRGVGYCPLLAGRENLGHGVDGRQVPARMGSCEPWCGRPSGTC